MKSLKAALISFVISFPLLFSCALDKAQPIDPAHVMRSDEHLRLGSVYESQARPELALREYERAAELDPDDPKAHFAAANVYLKMKKYADAEKWYSSALRLSPANPLFHNNRAWALMESGELDRAALAAKTALELDPQRGYIYLDTLGVIEMRRGDFSAAEGRLTRAADSAPSNEIHGTREIYLHLHELYVKTDDREKAARIEGMLKGIQPR